MEEKKKGDQRSSLGRREMLRVMPSAPAAALIPLAPARAANTVIEPARRAAAAATKATTQRKVLNDPEWKRVRLLCDLIIPADERSGSATQAGVPEFIDDWLDFRGGQLLAEIRGGLTWLDMECNRRFNHHFADCADAERKQIIDRIAYPDKAAPENASALGVLNQLLGVGV